MSVLYTSHRVQQADIVVRRKKIGPGLHWGTGISGGLVAETKPDTGKRVTTLEGFGDGEEVFILRHPGSVYEKALVQWRALLNIGAGYVHEEANCEHDTSFAQTGIASSPTVDGIKTFLGLVLAAAALYAMSDDEPQKRAVQARGRRRGR